MLINKLILLPEWKHSKDVRYVLTEHVITSKNFVKLVRLWNSLLFATLVQQFSDIFQKSFGVQDFNQFTSSRSSPAYTFAE